ncbi:MAG: XkdQ/YqbQ family protein [Chloroflexota bacterium]
MSIDVAALRYDLLLVLPDGDTLSLRPALSGLQWEEQRSELAMRLQALLVATPDTQTARGPLHQLVALGAKVVALAEWGEGWREVFRGTVMDWRYSDDGAPVVQVTCYDELIWLARSEDAYVFPQHTPALDILQRLFQDWSVPTGVIDPGLEVRLSKFVHRGSLADLVFTVLSEVFTRAGQVYLVRAREGVVDVVRPGQNTPLYHLRGDVVTSLADEQTITTLVTEVHVVGEQAEGLLPNGTETVRPALDLVAAIDDPAIRAFGRFRALVSGQANDDPEVLGKRAAAILAERGAPQRTRQLVAPDLPFLRRGDVVRVTAGTMVDELVPIAGISHDADGRTMSLTIDSSGLLEHRQKQVTPEQADQLLPDLPVGAPIAPPA